MENQVHSQNYPVSKLFLTDERVVNGTIAIGNHFLHYDVLDSRLKVGAELEVHHEAGHSLGRAKIVAINPVPFSRITDTLAYMLEGENATGMRRKMMAKYDDAAQLPWNVYVYEWLSREPSAFECLTALHASFRQQRIQSAY